jgi:hypothetical protein
LIVVLRPLFAAALVVRRRYFIVAPKPLLAAPLAVHRRCLIVVPMPMPEAPRMYLIVVYRPLPAAPLVVRCMYMAAPLRLEIVPHAALDGTLGRLLHRELQRNAAEPALFRSLENSTSASVGAAGSKDMNEGQRSAEGGTKEKDASAHKGTRALTPWKYESLSLRASAAHQTAPCVSWVLRVRFA